jgi:hypothetical protein
MPKQSSQRALSLLKLHFNKNENGVWAIQGMKGIPLRPRGGEEDSFFELQNDLVVGHPAFLGTIHSVLGQSIVPVVAHVPGERVLRCLGTGFFISCSGLLVTAAHVITDPVERRYGGVKELDNRTWYLGDLKLGVMVPLNPFLKGNGYIFRDIEWASFLAERTEHPLPIRGVGLKLTSDTAICQVAAIADGIPHQPLSIVQSGIIGTGMAVGKTATAVGYGEMREAEISQESEHIVSGDFAFGLHVSTGEILEHFPDNLSEKRVSTPGACFSASLQLPAGMSGSPIFDHEGIYVHGVVSKGWVDEAGLANFGYGSMLAHSLVVPIRALGDKTLLDLKKGNDHGFPRISAPGL